MVDEKEREGVESILAAKCPKYSVAHERFYFFTSEKVWSSGGGFFVLQTNVKWSDVTFTVSVLYFK